jgi:hypothetical protein
VLKREVLEVELLARPDADACKLGADFLLLRTRGANWSEKSRYSKKLVLASSLSIFGKFTNWPLSLAAPRPRTSEKRQPKEVRRMARRGDGLYQRGKTWRLDFYHEGKRHVVTIGKNILEDGRP